MKALFFALLSQSNKASALKAAVESLQRDPAFSPAAYEVDPKNFSLLPKSPLAYWVSQSLRLKFREFPSFGQPGHEARLGLHSCDDFRFIRAWWEVDPSHLLDGSAGPYSDDIEFQRWCRERTYRGKKWCSLAKGGTFSPHYSDVYLVVNWARDGEELKSWASQLYGGWSRLIQSESFYFKPGLTWPIRTQGGFSVRALPAGCGFGHKGPAAFSDRSELAYLLALTNSKAFAYLVNLQMVFGSYEVGVIQRTPVPSPSGKQIEELSTLALKCASLRQAADTVFETSHVFTLPAAIAFRRGTLSESLAAYRSDHRAMTEQITVAAKDVDQLAFRMYEVSASDQLAIERWAAGATVAGRQAAEADENEPSDEEVESNIDLDQRLASDLIAYLVGCAFGRWDARVACDASLAPKLAGPFDPLPVCSPAMLIGPDGLLTRRGTISSEAWLRARPNAITLPSEGSVDHATIPDAEYPLEVAWDGILVDDEGHPQDVVARVHAGLDLLWGERADNIERETCELLEVKDVREYFRNPRGFWENHVKRYSRSRRKAPIYWLLQSSKRSYALWLYYHRLDGDLLFKALTNYVDPKIQLEGGRLRDLEAQRVQIGTTGTAARQLDRGIERQEALLAELEDFRDKLRKAASLGLKPDLDDGVVLNAAPLWELMPWKVAKNYWEELRQGKYEWSSISKQLGARGLVR